MDFLNTQLSAIRLIRGISRFKYFVGVLFQALLSLVDLVGIVLIGTIGVISTEIISGQSTSNFLLNFIRAHLGFESQEDLIIALLLTAVSLFILKSILSLSVNRWILAILSTEQSRIGSALISKLLGTNFSWIRNVNPHEISSSVISGTSAAILNTLGHISVILSELSLAFLFIGLLFFLQPTVAIYTIVYLGLLLLVLNYLIGYRVSDFNRDMTLARINADENLFTTLKLFREIRISNKSSWFSVKSSGQISRHAVSLAKDIWIQQIPKYVLEIALVLGTLGIYFVMSTFSNTKEVFQIVAIYLAGSLRIFPSILRMQNSIFSLRAFNYLAKNFHTLNFELENEKSLLDVPSNPHNRLSTLNRENTVEVKAVNLSFCFDDSDIDVLSSLNISISSGERLALVGPSGSGKSTLTDVILGLLTPRAGSMSISGLSASDWIKTDSNRAGYVPQDTHLFPGTILDNVCLGDPSPNLDFVRETLDRVGIGQFVQSMPDGLQTKIGHGGLEVSGGQKQRIGIARALYRRPALLVLDESTSSLDGETEKFIMDSIFNDHSIKVVVAIAHRLSAIKSFDRIVYLEAGRVLGDGSYENLLENVPQFARQITASKL
jgi:ABC-type multidrug transport system fused ATPase/permease subunit